MNISKKKSSVFCWKILETETDAASKAQFIKYIRYIVGSSLKAFYQKKSIFLPFQLEGLNHIMHISGTYILNGLGCVFHSYLHCQRSTSDTFCVYYSATGTNIEMFSGRFVKFTNLQLTAFCTYAWPVSSFFELSIDIVRHRLTATESLSQSNCCIICAF